MSQTIPTCHVVAMPYPGRGHINPMLNLCRLLLRARPGLLVSFIVTEEWLGFLRSADLPPPPPNLTFRTIPNVIPSEIGRGKDFAGFLEATLTKMEAPVEQLLDRLPAPEPSVIVYDTYLSWVVGVGNQRNIPVASLFTMSATVFSTFHHFDLIAKNAHFTSDQQAKDQTINYIPGVPSIKVGDLPTPFYNQGQEVLPRALEAINLISKAQYLLFSSIYEFESEVINSLKKHIYAKIYSIGPLIPHLDVIENHLDPNVDQGENPEYMKWLDAQPPNSVLYISQGSFLSVSNAQLDEIIAGVCASGVRFLWIGRGEGWKINNENGIVVAWCDQLKVLCHPSIGGFWSHCGWNSTKEGAFAGISMLTFPIFWDQVTNSMLIVDKWKTGVRAGGSDETLVRREEITKLVLEVMSLESDAAKERRIRAKEIQNICKNACARGGSSEVDILNFIQDISRR